MNEATETEPAVEPAEPRQRSGWWRTGALLVVIAILFVSSTLSLRGERVRRSDESSRLALESLAEARQLYLVEHWPGIPASQLKKQQREVLDKLRKLADTQASAPAVRRLAIMQYVTGIGDWQATLLRIRSLPQDGSPFGAERELDLWRRAFDSGTLGPADVPSLRAQIDRLHLGWYRHLALEEVYRRAGMEPAAKAESSAARWSSILLFIATLLAICAGILGIVIGIAVVAWLKWGPPQPAPGPRISRTAADALYVVFLSYLAAFAAARLGSELILRPILVRHVQHLSLTGNLLISLFLTLISLIFPLAVFLVYRARGVVTFRDVGFRSSNLFLDGVWGVAAYLMGLPLVFVASILSERIFRSFVTPTNPAINMFAGASSLAAQILLFAEAAIIAPVVEETLFRGVFFGALKPRAGVPLSVVIASAVFAILHPQLPLGFLGIFVLGVVFNTVRTLRDSLAPSMIAHAINNGAILVLLALLVGD